MEPAPEETSLDVVPPEWRGARALVRYHQRCVAGVVGFTALTGFLALGLRFWPGTVLGTVLALSAAVTLVSWQLLAFTMTRGERAMRRAFRAWESNLAREIVVAQLARLYASVATEGDPIVARHCLREFDDAVLRAGVAATDPALQALHNRAMQIIEARAPHFDVAQQTRTTRALIEDTEAAELRARAAIARAQQMIALGNERRARAEADEAEARALKSREDLHKVRAIAWPEGPVPLSSIPRDASRMRAAAEEMERESRRGVVVESPVVGALLKENTRWAAHASPSPITRELLALFDPSDDASHSAVAAGRDERGEEKKG